ncbi:hypothetical protein FRC19_004312 [Serendipita sp. 401]|nr:hypothetical protein FRC19_004312 [Serendipita sp. 401]KAG9055367.1 hypothetical protein FS842_002389 [Serendipita sp. 407]
MSRRKSFSTEVSSEDEFYSVADPLERPQPTIIPGPSLAVQSNGANELFGSHRDDHGPPGDNVSLRPIDSISNIPVMIDERDASDQEEEGPPSEEEAMHLDEDEEWHTLASTPFKLRESDNSNDAKTILCANAVAFVIYVTRSLNQRKRSKSIDFRKLLPNILAIYSQWDDSIETDTEEILTLPMFSMCFRPGSVSKHPNTVEGLTIVIESNMTAALLLENEDHVACVLPAPTDDVNQPVILFTPEDSEGHARNHASFLKFVNSVDAAYALWQYFLAPREAKGGGRRTREPTFSAYVLSILPPLSGDTRMAPIYRSNIGLLSSTINARNFTADEAADQRSIVTMQKNIKVEETKAFTAIQAREKMEIEIKELEKELENVQKLTDTMFHEHSRHLRIYPGSQMNANASASASASASANASTATVPLDPDQQREAASQSTSAKSGKKSSGLASIVKRPFQLFGASSSGSSTTSGSSSTGSTGTSTPLTRLGKGSSTKARQRPPSWSDDSALATPRMQPGVSAPGSMDPSLQQAMLLQAQFDQSDPSVILARQLEEQDRAEAAAFQKLQQAEQASLPFYCDLDADYHPQGDKVMIEQCQHEMCRGCLLKHIKTQVNDARWPIYCPLCPANGRGRRGVVSRWIAEIVGADEKIFENWARMELSGLAINVECPQCKKSTAVDAEDFRTADKLDCRNCGAHWCKNCNRLIERGATHSCDGEAEYREHIAGNPNLYKRCPSTSPYPSSVDGSPDPRRQGAVL